ncbi:MFS transporter [Chloroflexota bacterium]
MQTRRYWFLGLLLPGSFFIHQIMMAHLAPHAIDIEITPAIAATIISIIGFGSIIGRNLAGFVSDKIGARLYLSICLFIVTLALVLLLFTRDLWMFYLFAVMYGIAQGGIPITQTMIIGDLFGLQYLGAIMASTMVMGSIGGALGPPIAGGIFDANGSYHLAFIICLSLGTLAFILSLFLLRDTRDN